MKSLRAKAPTRWRDRGADALALEARAALLAEAARQAPPLGAEALARVRAAAQAERPDRRAGAFRWRLAFAVGLLLASVTTAGGAGMLWRRYVASQTAAVPSLAGEERAAAPHRAPHRRRAPVPEAPPAADVPAPPEERPEAEATVPVPSPAPPRTRAVARPVSPPEPAPPTTRPLEPGPTAGAGAAPSKVTESGLVAEALSELRQRNDPRAALATLDRHARAFPHGVLETEALRTRVEALLRLDDLKTALAVLDSEPGLPEVLGGDLLLTRAELRAAAGRFQEALADFDELLDKAGAPLSAGGDERALYGRAVCLGRLGRDTRARAELREYARRFPNGRFAAEAQRLLAEPSPPP
jgi:tetratricopeptide (TPR) repeat protein